MKKMLYWNMIAVWLLCAAAAFAKESQEERAEVQEGGAAEETKSRGRVYISGINAEFTLTGRYDRSFGAGGGAGADGILTLNQFFNIGAAAAYEQQSAFQEAYLALSVNSTLPFIPPLKDNLRVYLLYYYQALPGYDIYSNSIIPALCLYGKHGGIITGYHARITEFWEEYVFEKILSFKVYWIPLSGRRGALQFEWANFDTYKAGSTGAWFLRANGTYTFTKNISFTASLIYLQSGGVGLASNFYGAGLQTGARFSW